MAAGETYRLCAAAGRSARRPSSMLRKAGSTSRDSASASRIVNLSEGFFEPNQLSAVIERQENYEMNEAKIARIVGICFGTLWIVIFGLRLLSGT
jgi:hypothetical protein